MDPSKGPKCYNVTLAETVAVFARMETDFFDSNLAFVITNSDRTEYWSEPIFNAQQLSVYLLPSVYTFCFVPRKSQDISFDRKCVKFDLSLHVQFESFDSEDSWDSWDSVDKWDDSWDGFDSFDESWDDWDDYTRERRRGAGHEPGAAKASCGRSN